MKTPLRSVSRKAPRSVTPRSVKACPPVAPSCDYPVPAPPASVRRVKAPPPVVAPPVIFVRVLSQGRCYVTFSGVKGAESVRVTYSRTGYVRILVRDDALAVYADLVTRGYRDPAALLARDSAA